MLVCNHSCTGPSNEASVSSRALWPSHLHSQRDNRTPPQWDATLNRVTCSAGGHSEVPFWCLCIIKTNWCGSNSGSGRQFCWHGALWSELSHACFQQICRKQIKAKEPSSLWIMTSVTKRACVCMSFCMHVCMHMCVCVCLCVCLCRWTVLRAIALWR